MGIETARLTMHQARGNVGAHENKAYVMTQILNAILSILFALCESIFQTLGDIAVSAVTPRRKTEYNATFGQVDEQFGRNGAGFWVGTHWSTTILESHNHLICFGGSGSKKSSCVGFPMLLKSRETSYIIHDSAREFLNGTATDFHNNGYKVVVYDYDNVDQSISFNVLAKCTSESDVYRMAKVLIKNSLHGGEYDYWAQSAEEIIGFFSYLLWLYADKPQVTLPSVTHMIQVFSYNPEAIDTWLLKHCVDSRIISRYKALVATPEKTLQCSLATAKNALAIFNDPSIAKLVSTDGLNFESFRREKTVLFICGSPAKAEYCRSISAIFFESFFATMLTDVPPKDSLGITLCIDEAATMNLVTLPKALELGRKFRISIATLWQDQHQIEHLYGKHQAANILANSKLKIFMPSGIPLETCIMLKNLLGKFQFIDQDGITRTKELLNEQEIFQLKQILVLNGNNKPLLVEPKPYFEDKKLFRRTQVPQFQFTNAKPVEPPALIQFE